MKGGGGVLLLGVALGLLLCLSFCANSFCSVSSNEEEDKSVCNDIPTMGEGDRIPSVQWRIRKLVRNPEISKGNPYDWATLTTNQVFDKRRIVIFALPGAFTPTCMSTHFPGYEALYDEILQQGIDEVYCLSVNDSFVMNAWKDRIKSMNVKLIPDGNGIFTQQMGMLVDKSNFGFGKRSWRYSMVVTNGLIEKLFVEHGCRDLAEDDPLDVSSAETMLVYLKNTTEN